MIATANGEITFTGFFGGGGYTITLTTSPSADHFAKVTTAWSTPQTMTAQDYGNLKAGITKIRVYMWVEGQDVDCENGASGTDIAYTIQFSTKK